MGTKYKINFKDAEQDLLSVTIEAFGSEEPSIMGEIVAIEEGCSDVLQRLYIGKAVDLADNEVGDYFNHADPMDGFKARTTRWVIESIEKLEGEGDGK